MNVNENYENFAHAQADLKEKISAFFREYFAVIILAINIALNVALELFQARLENPFTPEFFIKLGIDIATSMFCYCCFIAYGKKREKLSLPSYAEDVEHWHQLSAKVRSSRLTEFVEFCKRRVEDEREERRKAIIENNTTIPWSDYQSLWRGKTKKDIREKQTNGDISKRNAKYVNRANGVIKIKPINPLVILCGVKVASVNDAGREKIGSSTISVLMRPVTMLVINALTSMVHGAWRGISTGEEAFGMLMSTFVLIVASFSGYSAGVSGARKEHDLIKGKIFFLEEFEK